MQNQQTEIVFLRSSPGWRAPDRFISSLAASLRRQTGRDAIEMSLAELSRWGVARGGPGWVLVRVSPEFRVTPALGAIASYPAIYGHLLGPGDPAPPPGEPAQFVVQMAERPTLRVLDAHHRLIHDASDHNRPTPRFLRTVDSIARCIAGIQIGLALGGGAALGWVHVGVLEALESAGVPVDVIAGCSMGGAIGALYASGYSIAELKAIAHYWKGRTARFVEWQVWRMSLVSESQVSSVFLRYFGGVHVNQTEIPFWANSVDLGTGAECAIRAGRLDDCVRAAVASPGMLLPVRNRGRVLVDAAILEPVPARLARTMGSDFTIAVNVLPRAAGRTQGLRFQAWQSLSRAVLFGGRQIPPAEPAAHADVMLEPDLSGIGLFDFARAPELIECGRRSAEQHMDWVVKSYASSKKVPASFQPSSGRVARAAANI